MSKKRRQHQPPGSIHGESQLAKIGAKKQDQVEPKSPPPDQDEVDLGCLTCQKVGEHYGTYIVNGTTRYVCCQRCGDDHDPASAEIRRARHLSRVSSADYEPLNHRFTAYEGGTL